MDLNELKALAEQFRAVADDKHAIKKLADDTLKKTPHTAEVDDLCKKMKTAADAAAVNVIADEVKARTT